MSTDAPDYLHEADMGFTRMELMRGLKNAVTPYTIVDTTANPILITSEQRVVKLHTGPDGARVIASMRIPRLAVRLEFYGFNNNQHEMFMERFKRSLHKGGG